MKKYLILCIVLLQFSIIIGQSSSLMTYNIKYDATWDTINNWNDRKETMAKMIQHYQPDIIGTQEGLHHQLEYLNNQLSDYTYVGFARTDGKTKGEYTAIFYNTTIYNVIKTETFWLSPTPEKFSVGWDASMERICTYAIFQHKESQKKLLVFNTHFDHVGMKARVNSTQLILDKISAINIENLPVVVMGDFNLTPETKPIQLIQSQLDYGLAISKEPFYGPYGTFNGFKNEPITTRIDYIFTKNVTVNSYIHIDDKLDTNKHISDHLPVLINIQHP